MKPKKHPILIALLIALVSLLAVPFASAQTMTLTYGMGVVGNVDPSSPFVFYSFTGNEGDLASVHLMNLSSDYQPAISITGPTGQQVAFSNYDITRPGNNARLDFTLPQSGSYGLQVSAPGGGSGQFALRLDGVSTLNASSIATSTEPTPVAFSESPVQVLQVVGSPSSPQWLQIQGGEVRFAASIHLEDGTLLAVFTSNMMGVGEFALPPSDGTYTIVVHNLDESPDPVFVILSADAAPTTGSTTGQPSAPVSSDPSVCTVSTGGAVNLRGGPGTSYEILASVPGGSSYTATGQNSGWYVIEYQGITGWIAGGVTTVTGNCSGLPLIPAPGASTPSTTDSTAAPTLTGPTSTPPPTTEAGAPTNTPPPTEAGAPTNTPPPTEAGAPTEAPTEAGAPTDPPPTEAPTEAPTEVAVFPGSPTQYSYELPTSLALNGSETFTLSLPSPGWHLVRFRVTGLSNQVGNNYSRMFNFVVSCTSNDLRWGAAGQLGATPNTCNQATSNTFRFDSNQLYLSIKLEGGPDVTYSIIATRID